MAYATILELEARLPAAHLEAATGETQGEAAYDAALNAALTTASAEVDSWAGARYETPLESSERVKSLTLDVAAYRVQLKNNVVRDSERQAYEDALSFLRRLADGKVSLDQPTGAAPQAVGGAALARADEDRVFSDTHLDGF